MSARALVEQTELGHMSSSTLNNKAFPNGITLPHGEFTNFKRFEKQSRQAKELRKLPVLTARFDAKRFDFKPGLPAHVGWGAVPIGEGLALTFRLQYGPNVLYWLANPADKSVWDNLSVWNKAGRMVLAAEFDGLPTMLLTRDFELSPPYSDLRHLTKEHREFTPLFLRGLGLAYARDQLKGIATSDLPGYRKLHDVQVCQVVSKDTPPLVIDAMTEGGALTLEVRVPNKSTRR
jgi:hypothetical protein